MLEYPAETTLELATILRTGTLQNGLPIMIRPLLPSDRDLVASSFQLLSERSRFLRFLTGKGKLSEAALRTLVDDVDQHDHVALAMFWVRKSRPEILIGVGRFIVSSADPGSAEVAVTIGDQVHGQGAGRLMLQALADRARALGVRRFTATMTVDNTPSRRMMAGVGDVTHDAVVDGLREMVVELR